MHALIAGIRAPHEAMLRTELAHTDGLLYRRGTFAGTLRRPHLRCAARPARCRDRALPGLPLGRHADRGRGGDLGRRLQRHRDHLSRGLSHGHDGRRRSRPSWRTSPTTRSTPIPTCSRAATWCGSAAWATRSSVDGAMGSRIANLHLLGNRRADRAREGLHRGGLGLGQRGHRRPADLGRGRSPPQGPPACSRQPPRKSVKVVRAGADRPPRAASVGTHPWTSAHAHTSLHPPGRGAGGPRELPVAVRAAAGAAVPRLHQRHHHRADDGRRPPRCRSCLAPRRAGLRAVRAGLHHGVRGAGGRRLGARAVGAGPQGPALRRRRARHHRLRPAFPRAAARAAALSPGALSHAS